MSSRFVDRRYFPIPDVRANLEWQCPAALTDREDPMTTETSPSTGAAARNATDFTAEAQRRAPPNPALRTFDRAASTRYTRGRTLDSGVVNIMGHTPFEFLSGGYFRLQRGRF